MAGSRWYSDQDALSWYEVYKDHTVTVRRVAEIFGIKHCTMLSHFRRLKLKLRPSGFRPNNCHGKDGVDNERLRILWFFKFAYKRRAKRKGLEVTLTDNQFVQLVTSECHYCGRPSKLDVRTINKRSVNMLTVDRMDSSKGYTTENCVSCCKRCNTIKMDMTYDEFVRQVKAIVDHMKV